MEANEKTKKSFVLVPLIALVAGFVISAGAAGLYAGPNLALWITILGTGMTSTLIITISLLISYLTKTKAESYAAQLTTDLQTKTQEIDRQKLLQDTLIELLPIGIFLTSYPLGTPLLANQEAIRLLGKSIDPKADKSTYAQTYRLFKKDGTPYPNDELPLTQTLEKGKRAKKTDIYIKQSDSSMIPIWAESVPVRDKNGKIFAGLTVFQDMTLQTEMDQQKTALVSLASHQLRTPLTSMRWYIEYLRDDKTGPMNEDQKMYLSELYKSALRMIDTVNSLVNVSRIELQTFSPTISSVNVIKETNQVISELAPIIEEYKQKLDFSTKDILGNLLIDPTVFRATVTTLLNNSLKYSPKESKITLLIQAAKGDKEGMEIIVEDFGYGIPKAEIPKIFSKLYRGSNIKDKDTYGNGLGLYAVKTMVEKCGGTITFTSEENKGTTFNVYLPAKRDEPKPAPELK